MLTQSFLNLISSHSGITSEFNVWHLHIWKLHLYTRGDLPWLSLCGAWSASPCLWYLWLEGGDRPWHLGEVAAFTSAALFLEAVDLAVPSTTDWSSLSLLLAGVEKTDGKMGQWWIPKICTLMSENINRIETLQPIKWLGLYELGRLAEYQRFYLQLSIPVFLFFFGGTPRLLRFGLCFFEAPPVCDSFCRFWLADATKEKQSDGEGTGRLWNELPASISLVFHLKEK